MNESWIQVGTEQYAIRTVLKRLHGSRGVGISQLNVVLELNCQKAIAERVPLWLRGNVSIRNLGPHSGYLANLQCAIQPIELLSLGATREITLTADLSSFQLQTIEDLRTGSIVLNFDLSGHCIVESSSLPFWGVQFEHEISQSDWINILERLDHRRILLIELDSFRFQQSPELAQALKYFDEAQKHYLAHDWRLTVESLRQSLSALVGKNADEEEAETETVSSLNDLRRQAMKKKVGYQERYEPIRAALKFFSDIGSHPDVEETGKHHAYSALLMVAGLLHGRSNK